MSNNQIERTTVQQPARYNPRHILFASTYTYVRLQMFDAMNPNTKNIRCFLYARKSSESDERQVQSIDDQIGIMKEIAKDFGLTIVEVFTESKSAKAPGIRPVFTRMIERLEAGEANGLLVWKIDRLSRNPIDSATLQWMLQQDIVKIIQTVGRAYYPEDNALIFSVESSMANQYIRDLSKNVKRGLKSKLDKGWMPGTAPLGYLNTKAQARGDNYIVKDPERFPIIRKAWDLMLTGTYTPPQILEKLNNEWNFRTRMWKKRGSKPMSRSTIYRIFTNPFYAGIIPYKGLYVEGKHPPMITVDEFDRVQILLGRKGKPRPKRYQYAYPGLITCGECDGMISATFKEKLLLSTGELKSYSLYYCIRARKQAARCSQRRYTNMESLDEQIAQKIEQYTILPEFKDWALAILAEGHEKEVEERTAIHTAQQKALDNAQRQLDNLTGMRLRDLIDDNDFMREKSRLQLEIVRLKGQRQNTETRAEEWQQFTEDAFEFAYHARQAFLEGDIETKKGILAAIGLNCVLKDKNVAIQSQEWLVPIESKYQPIADQIEAFELTKKPYNKRQKEAFASLSPQVRALVDDVGTGIKATPREYLDRLRYIVGRICDCPDIPSALPVAA